MRKTAKHPVCRPPREVTNALWLAGNGRWSKDDGRPHEVFIVEATTATGTPLGGKVYAAKGCDCAWSDCPAARGGDEACARWDSASFEYLKPSRT